MAWTELTRVPHIACVFIAFSVMFARRGRRAPLHCNDRMPMAYVAQRLPSGFNGSGLFLRVA
jgi:hypothetical protein